MTTLCRERLTADNSEIGWLWPTCAECNGEAHRIVRDLPASSTGWSA
ncbi:hypothetical protein HNR68_000233 [Saccharopolyspora hordei]|uniref:Uncharacterized protein n=1 Tax=Saccharopolyspora hordei TaxID=1838 RepID=A0A853AH13_9PSEU|nr:hypothetical protein [Saccharopolyspora hordei]